MKSGGKWIFGAICVFSALLSASVVSAKSDDWKKADGDSRITAYYRVTESSGLQRLYFKVEKASRMKERKCRVTAMLRLEYRTTVDGDSRDHESDQPVSIEAYADKMQTIVAEADKIDRIKLRIKDSETGDCQKR